MGHIIQPVDFADRIEETGGWRFGWGGGAMRHLVAALDGRKVAVVTDTATGGVVNNVVLVAVVSGWAGNGYALRVSDTYTREDGREVSRETDYPLSKVGPVIDLSEFTDTKWKALRTFGDEVAAAIRLAQNAHGKDEGREWGRWRGTPMGTSAHVDVTYEPHTGNPHYAGRAGERGYWRIAV